MWCVFVWLFVVALGRVVVLVVVLVGDDVVLVCVACCRRPLSCCHSGRGVGGR